QTLCMQTFARRNPRAQDKRYEGSPNGSGMRARKQKRVPIANPNGRSEQEGDHRRCLDIPYGRLGAMQAGKKDCEYKQRVGQRWHEHHQERAWSEKPLQRGIRQRVGEIEIVNRKSPARKKNIAICDGFSSDEALSAVGILRETRCKIEPMNKSRNSYGCNEQSKYKRCATL